MVLQVIVCALAAAGLLLIVWCAVGRLLLPVSGDAVSVYAINGSEKELTQTVRAFEWLCQSGLLAGTLYVLDDEGDEALSALARELCEATDCVRLCTRKELREILKLE